MVNALPLPDDDGYDELQERWLEQRPSRKAAKRAYRRKNARQIVVTAERLPQPNTTRMSSALLAAQRELAKAQAERDAEAQEHGHE